MNESLIKKYTSLNQLAHSNGIVIFGCNEDVHIPIGELRQAFSISTQIYNRSIYNISVENAIDIYDIQKHIHPSKRVYAPGYVKLKEFKYSDICKYYNAPIHMELYPRDQIITSNYITGVVKAKDTLFKKQTGMNVKLDIDTANYYYDAKIGYQPLAVAMVNPYMSYAYNMCYNPYNVYHAPQMKEMCTIVRKE